MFDLTQIEGFEWDEGNERKSLDKHSVSQREAEQVFFSSPLFVLEDVRHSQNEPRFQALGKTDAGRLLHVTFTTRDRRKRIRIISARDMNRKERKVYEEKSQIDS